LGASIVGFVPGGDIAKAAVKGATKAVKGAAKAGAKAADDVGKVVKGSTAAADGPAPRCRRVFAPLVCAGARGRRNLETFFDARSIFSSLAVWITIAFT